MRTIPLALLVFRGGCPVTEAYLTYMRLHGLRPELILAIDYVGEGPRALRLRRLLGTELAARLLRIWRNRAARVSMPLATMLQQNLPVQLTPGSEPDYVAAAQRVLHLTVEGYADPRLLDTMHDCGVSTFLYCSGGRVPAELFRQNFRILHVHPGVVPYVRGSDGLLWSLLMRGRPGASCFYMDADIDTGRLIAASEYEPPRWPELRAKPDALYHGILQCYDPHLRAALLVALLQCQPPGQDLAMLASTEQPLSGGHCYTMHPKLRERILARLCI